MKLPRDVSGRRLISALTSLGYRVTRQRGSHVRLTTQVKGEHHEVVPLHDPVKTGTLGSILKNVAHHHGLTIQELVSQLNL